MNGKHHKKQLLRRWRSRKVLSVQPNQTKPKQKGEERKVVGCIYSGNRPDRGRKNTKKNKKKYINMITKGREQWEKETFTFISITPEVVDSTA